MKPQDSLFLDFPHHSILVLGQEDSVLQKLKDEFHYFVREKAEAPGTRMEFHLAPSPELPKMVAAKILPACTIFQLGPTTYVQYPDGLIIREQNITRIFSEDPARLFELLFLAIYSDAGEALDRAGLVRIHALAVAVNGVNAVVMLPSGGGKSTLLTELLNHDDVRIVSDDMPLCDLQGRIFAFPTKLGLAKKPTEGFLGLTWHEFSRAQHPPKWTASLATKRHLIEEASENNPSILIEGKRLSGGKSVLQEVPRYRMLRPLLEHMVIGAGLPQVIELFLNFNVGDVLLLVKHGFIRTVAATMLLLRSRCYIFYMGSDIQANANLLRDTLHGLHHS